jgi:hypothetical protein
MVTTRASKKTATPTPTADTSGKSKPTAQQGGEEEDSDNTDDLQDCSDQELKPPPEKAVKKAKVAGSAGSVSSNTSQRSRLDLFIEKQLLADIEAKEGGLHYFDQGDRLILAKLLDERPHIYGQRGEPIRKKISRRLTYLKGLHIRDYRLLLKNNQVEPATLSKSQNLDLERKHRKTPLKQFQKRPSHIKETVQEEDVSDLDQDDNEEVEDDFGSAQKPRQPAPHTPSKSATKKPDLVSSVGKRTVLFTAAPTMSGSYAKICTLFPLIIAFDCLPKFAALTLFRAASASL